MNYQTREKITNIRTAKKKGATVEEIDKSYFKTKTIKITFLTRNKNYFDPEELKYLKVTAAECGKTGRGKTGRG